ncbi:hypothetical protein QJS66_16900 [Kocuria rhizophila]|nr:hypothetical protein QJS66_16900 [Kocuria rhizophila]
MLSGPGGCVGLRTGDRENRTIGGGRREWAARPRSGHAGGAVPGAGGDPAGGDGSRCCGRSFGERQATGRLTLLEQFLATCVVLVVLMLVDTLVDAAFLALTHNKVATQYCWPSRVRPGDCRALSVWCRGPVARAGRVVSVLLVLLFSKLTSERYQGLLEQGQAELGAVIASISTQRTRAPEASHSDIASPTGEHHEAERCRKWDRAKPMGWVAILLLESA